jgi:hypothetical protein
MNAEWGGGIWPSACAISETIRRILINLVVMIYMEPSGANNFGSYQTSMSLTLHKTITSKLNSFFFNTYIPHRVLVFS